MCFWGGFLGRPILGVLFSFLCGVVDGGVPSTGKEDKRKRKSKLRKPKSFKLS